MEPIQGWIQPTAETQPFFDGAKEGVLRLQVCEDCSTWMYPLKSLCQQCGSSRMAWCDATGAGTLYAHATLHRQYHPRHEGRLPLIIAWVDLEEGVRMPTNIVGANSEDLKAGTAVQVAFEDEPGGWAIPVFEVTA